MSGLQNRAEPVGERAQHSAHNRPGRAPGHEHTEHEHDGKDQSECPTRPHVARTPQERRDRPRGPAFPHGTEDQRCHDEGQNSERKPLALLPHKPQQSHRNRGGPSGEGPRPQTEEQVGAAQPQRDLSVLSPGLLTEGRTDQCLHA